MSNDSLLLRLRKTVCDYESTKLSSQEFSMLLDGIIESLEGVPYRVIREMRAFRYRIEISGFHDEDENISDRETVVEELRAWIEGIEKQGVQK